jgi:hypothetical protein
MAAPSPCMKNSCRVLQCQKGNDSPQLRQVRSLEWEGHPPALSEWHHTCMYCVEQTTAAPAIVIAEILTGGKGFRLQAAGLLRPLRWDPRLATAALGGCCRTGSSLRGVSLKLSCLHSRSSSRRRAQPSVSRMNLAQLHALAPAEESLSFFPHESNPASASDAPP